MALLKRLLKKSIYIFALIVFLIFMLKSSSTSSPPAHRFHRRDPQISQCGNNCPPPSPTPTAPPGQTVVTVTETSSSTSLSIIPETTAQVPTTLPDGQVTYTSVVIPQRTSTIVNVVTGTRTTTTPTLQASGGVRARGDGTFWMMAALIGVASFFAAF
ncbi:8041_t:CDS:2 [Paraglomus brasilianum]|uniref:8041_t:CDS:1 n=1 Tax=Paraglomus brasilianum TaxID=144538 RepID=A0A9N8ZBT7_9GLOM|nr:8041_t:CDS:2 [Paraglomus brasilianum]